MKKGMTNKRKNLLALIVAFTMIMGCLIIPTTNSVKAATKKLKVTVDKTVVVGKEIKIKTNIKSTFKSSNNKIATVTTKGILKAKKAGTVKITVTAKNNKKQKKVIKITVQKKKSKKTEQKNQPATQSVTNTPAVENSTTETPTTPTTPTTEAATETPTTERPQKVVTSIAANYTGGIVPLNCPIDFIDKLTVTANFSDGTSKQLEYGEYYLPEEIPLTIGTNTMSVTYNGFQTTFDVICEEPAENYVHILTARYSAGTYPLDTSKLVVVLKDFETHYVTTDYKYKYYGKKVVKNVEYHQYIIYYSDDFSIENNSYHVFASYELLIPVN